MKKRHIIIPAFLVIIILSLSFLFKFLLDYEKRKFYNNEKKSIEIHTYSLSNAIWYYFANLATYIKLSASYFEQKFDSTPTTNDLKLLYESISQKDISLINVGFLNVSGILTSICPTKHSQEVGINFSFRDYFKKVSQTNKSVISAPIYDYRPLKGEKKQRAIYLITPIFKSTAEKIGYLSLKISLDDISNLIKVPQNLADNIKLKYYVVDQSNNKFLYTPKNSGGLSHFLYKNETIKSFLLEYTKAAKTGECTLVKKQGGELFICSNKLNIQGTELTLIALIPYKEASSYSSSFLNRIFLMALYIAIIVIMVTGLIIYNEFILKKLNKRIEKLEILIDEKEKKKDLDQITHSEYFEDLKEKVKKIKNKQ